MKKLKIIIKYTFVCLGIIIFILIILGQLDFGNRYYDISSKGYKYLKLENNTIRYLQKGSGKDILLIHGSPGSIEDWQAIIDSLAKKCRVTAFDRLGQGYSTNFQYDYTINENAYLIKKLIEKLNLKSPMIIGHSYGGSIVANLLATHYNDTLSYIIIDSPLYDYKVSTTYQALATPFIGKGIGFIANYTVAEQLIEQGVKESSLNQTNKNLDQQINIRKKIWMQPKVLYAKAKESANYSQDLSNQSSNYTSINASIIIITGADSLKTFRAECQKFSNEVRTDTLVILKNTGHYIQLDQPQTVLKIINSKINSAILKFLWCKFVFKNY